MVKGVKVIPENVLVFDSHNPVTVREIDQILCIKLLIELNVDQNVAVAVLKRVSRRHG